MGHTSTVTALSVVGIIQAVAIAYLVLGTAPAPRQVDEASLLRDWSQPPPWPVFLPANEVLQFSDRLPGLVYPPSIHAMSVAMMFMRSQLFYTAAKLDFAESLAAGPLTASELASASGLPPESADLTFRVMRALVALGYFNEGRPCPTTGLPRFSNTAVSATLRRAHPNSIRPMVLHLTEDTYLSWGQLSRQLSGEGVAFPLSHNGTDFWDYLRAKPKQERQFSNAMTAVDALGVPATLSDYRWGSFKRFIDVGGAHGSFLAAAMRRFDGIQGVLFDQPTVIAAAREKWQPGAQWGDVQSRAGLFGGSFFDSETLPKGRDGDVWVLRIVLHDWDDEESVAILKSVRSAMGSARCTLTIVEASLAPTVSGTHASRALMDLHMALAFEGKERTTAQFEALFARSGFRLTGVHPTRGIFVIHEAVPV